MRSYLENLYSTTSLLVRFRLRHSSLMYHFYWYILVVVSCLTWTTQLSLRRARGRSASSGKM